MSNTIHSIQMKLKQLSKIQKKNHQLTLTRYFQERLLYRLSKSEFRNNFFLKGGALIYALEQETSRPTLDIDLLAEKVRIDINLFQAYFKKSVALHILPTELCLRQQKLKQLKSLKKKNIQGLG